MEEVENQAWLTTTSWACIIWFCLISFAVAWKNARRKKRSLWAIFAPDVCLRLGFTAFLFAGLAYLLCRSQHFCMAGHGRHFENLWPYLVDSVWQAGFVVTVFLAYRSEITFRYAFVYTIFIGVLFLATPMNLFSILTIPLLIACSVFWIVCLLDWID